MELDCEDTFSLITRGDGTEPKTVPKSGRTALPVLALGDVFDFPSPDESRLFFDPVVTRLDVTIFRVSLPDLAFSSVSLIVDDINVSKPNFSTVSTKRIPVNACAINQFVNMYARHNRYMSVTYMFLKG